MILINNSRFSTLFRFFFISLIVFMSLRIWLIFISWNEISQESIATVLSTLLIGLFYDSAFTFYICTPIIILLTMASSHSEKSLTFNFLHKCVFITMLFILYLTVAAELIFWGEFSTRFNFISVDYLIYSHEVSQNILESYSVNKIIAIVLLFVLATYSLTHKQKHTN